MVCGTASVEFDAQPVRLVVHSLGTDFSIGPPLFAIDAVRVHLLLCRPRVVVDY